MSATVVKRHPVRGALAGLLLGLGVALLLVTFAVAALGTLTPLVVVGVFVVLGLVFALVLPAGSPPADREATRPIPADAPPASGVPERPPSASPPPPSASPPPPSATGPAPSAEGQGPELDQP